MQNISRFKLLILPAFILMMMMGLNANAQKVISLQQAVDSTIKNNLTIRQAQLTEALADQDYQQAKYNELPSLSATPQGGYYFGKSQVADQLAYSAQALNINAQAALSLTLFQGKQLHNLILQNKLALDADRTSTEKIKNDLLLNVVTQYLTILTDQDLVKAAKEQLDIAKITLDRAQKNFDAGNATRADLAQAEAQVQSAQLTLTNDQNQLDIAILTLKQYMEMDPSTDIKIEIPDISKLTNVQTVFNATDVIKTAFAINPDIKLAELQEATSKQAIAVARGAYYPTVALYGGLGTSYSNQAYNYDLATGARLNLIPFNSQLSNNFNQFVGLNLTIPIFSKFANRTAVTKAKLNYEYAKVTTDLARNTLAKTITQAVLDLESAEKSYESAAKTFESNKEALNVTKQRYDAGLVNTLDYNTALTNYDTAQNTMIEDQYLVVFRSKVIDYYLGNPMTL
jgi:outer membrane protein